MTTTIILETRKYGHDYDRLAKKKKKRKEKKKKRIDIDSL